MCLISISGAPGRIRTHDPLVRSAIFGKHSKNKQLQSAPCATRHTLPTFAQVTLLFCKESFPPNGTGSRAPKGSALPLSDR
jgi:hypothetical protein